MSRPDEPEGYVFGSEQEGSEPRVRVGFLATGRLRVWENF